MKILLGCSLLLLSGLGYADPTQPGRNWIVQAQAIAPSSGALKLQLIKKNADQWLAIINGQQVRKGQYISDYKVLDITAMQVVIERNGNQQILSLHNTAIKKYE